MNLGDFEGWTNEEVEQHVISSWQHPQGFGGLELLIAYESVGHYGCDSSAFFILRDEKGNIFEVNGSHCSCYGFEDQWILEETSFAVLEERKWLFSTGGYDREAEENMKKVRDEIRRYNQS